MIEQFIYFFSFCAFISGFLVISSTNPVNSVFALVLCFANSSLLLIILGFEFLALLFMIVYVGALAILFLFVVMMLNIRLIEIMENSVRYLPIGLILGVVLIIELLIIIDQYYNLNPSNTESNIFFINDSLLSNNTILSNLTNVEAIGQIIYTEGYIYFLIASLVLLVAMIGAIVMTLYHEEEVKRQDIFSQISTDINLNYYSSLKSCNPLQNQSFKLRN